MSVRHPSNEDFQRWVRDSDVGHSRGDAFSCNCLSCEQQRAKLIRIGNLCVPNTIDPQRFSPGTCSFWHKGRWERHGWSNRFPPNIDETFLVLEVIDKKDRANGGHLDSVVIFSPRYGEVVTSARWLITVQDTKADNRVQR